MCRLYTSIKTDKSINDVRYNIFQNGTKDPEKLPPTRPSLHQHILNVPITRVQYGILPQYHNQTLTRQLEMAGLQMIQLEMCSQISLWMIHCHVITLQLPVVVARAVLLLDAYAAAVLKDYDVLEHAGAMIRICVTILITQAMMMNNLIKNSHHIRSYLHVIGYQ